MVDPLKSLLRFLLTPHSSVFSFGNDDAASLRGKNFDTIVIPQEFLNECKDVYKFFVDLRPHCHDRTRLVFSHQRLKSFFSLRDLTTFLQLSHYEVVTQGRTLRFQYLIARPIPLLQKPSTVSVIVPVRNERGNLAAIIERTPDLGTATEIIFVEGHSSDGTAEECERLIADYKGSKDLRLIRQKHKGKGSAIREGFEAARNEVLVILDGDLAIPPEELGYLYDAFLDGKGELMSASRLTYPMWKGAMPWLNQWGNPFFARAYSWLMGQPIKDLFGGTKMFRKSDYKKIDALRKYFKIDDPWGDLDLLFGAAKLGLKISDFPVHYHPRVYGNSNMRSFHFAFYLMRTFFKSIFKFKPLLRPRL